MNQSSIIRRRSLRAILLTPELEILLIKIENPDGEWTGWITPGGGIEPGENEATAFRRELWEELGFALKGETTHVWQRHHRFPWDGKIFEQYEDFYWIPTAKFEPRPQIQGEELAIFKEMRWWHLGELEQSKEIFAPRRLAAGVRHIVQNGFGKEPLDIGE